MNTPISLEDVLKNAHRAAGEIEPFWDALSKESDRAVAVIAVCVLDDLLERIIRASYVKNPQVKSLFKNDHILQSFFAKINIAYFSGLIPDVFYHDLKLICEIRNRFAHALIADLKFTDEKIVQHIDKFRFGPKAIIKLPNPRAKFTLVVSQIVGLLQVLEQILLKTRPAHLVELLNLNEATFPEWRLTDSEIRNLLRKS